MVDNGVFDDVHAEIGVLVSMRLMTCEDWVVVVDDADLTGVLAAE